MTWTSDGCSIHHKQKGGVAERRLRLFHFCLFVYVEMTKSAIDSTYIGTAAEASVFGPAARIECAASRRRGTSPIRD